MNPSMQTLARHASSFHVASRLLRRRDAERYRLAARVLMGLAPRPPRSPRRPAPPPPRVAALAERGPGG